MWQLKLSSGGGTYGIHFCFVFDDDWSFKPKNIRGGGGVSLCCEEKNTCSSYKKKVDSSTYSSSSVATRERRPTRVGTFNLSSLLRCRFAPYSGSQTGSAPKKQNFEDFLSVGNDTNQFCKRQFLRSAGKKKNCDDGRW